MRALVLYSGGLDSRLAVKILEEQNVEVIPVMVKLPISCIDTKIPFHIKPKIVDCTKGKRLKEFLEIVKKPKFGRGTSVNPCIDCKIFIIKKAASLMKKYNCQIIATGEVLGERPKSQHLSSLRLIEKESCIEILRPLSARKLPETVYERNNFVNRKKLLDISGRRRIPQFNLAKKYKIDYPSPAGGCILCEKDFGFKLKHLLNNFNKDTGNITLELLQAIKHTRVFFDKGYIIIARNSEQGSKLLELNKKLKFNLVFDNKGPTILYTSKKDWVLVKSLRQAYSTGGKNRDDFEKYKISYKPKKNKKSKDILGVENKVLKYNKNDAKDHTKIHYMRLYQDPFERISKGKKKFELRLYDRKRKKLKVNDFIIFTNLKNKKEKIKVKIINIHFFYSFEEALKKISLKDLGHCLKNDKEQTKVTEEILERLEKYYPRFVQEANKVVAIEIEKVYA